MRKILFLINTLKCGGAEKVLVETLNSMVGETNDITVQTIFCDGVFKEDLLPSVNYKTVVKDSSNFFVNLFYRICIRYMPKKIFYSFFIKDNCDYEIAFLEGHPTQYIAASTNTKAKKLHGFIPI